MKLLKKKGTTNITLLIFIQDSSSTTGAGKTGVTASMLTAYYARVEDDNDVTISAITVSDALGTGTDHSDGTLEEITANMPGWYRFDIPDACVATGADVCGISLIDAGANDIAQVTIEIQLLDVDLNDAVRMGLSSLPNAAADAAGGLPISDAGGLDMDTTDSNVSAILVDTGTTLDGKIDTIDGNVDQIETAVITNAAGTDIAADIIAMKVDTAAILIDTTGLNGDAMRGTDSVVLFGPTKTEMDTAHALLATEAKQDIIDTNVDQIETAVITNASGTDIAADIIAMKVDTAAILIDTTGLNGDAMRGTDSAALASVCTETRLVELASGNLPSDIDAILVDTGTTLDAAIAVIDLNVDQIETAVITNAAGTDVAADIIAMKVDTAATLVDTAEIGTAGAGLIDVGGMSSTMKAQVNTEVVDTLATDTYAEPGQGAPGATVSLSAKIGFLYKAWRNKKDQDASTFELYNDDASTVDHKASVSDDGTNTVIGEMETGP